MTTFMTNDEFAQQKGFDHWIRYIVTCGTAASLTTGDYFFYNNTAVAYYIWFDKNGDGTTDDPGVVGYTGVAVDISSATSAIEVATALTAAIDALTGSSATQENAIVYITNAANETDSSIVDYNTAFTFASDGYYGKNTFPTAKGLTLMRRRIYGNMLKYIPGSPNTTTWADTFLDIEYRGVELMIDKEQGRALEEGRAQYIPSDFIYSMDRVALAGMGTSGSFNRGVGY